MARYFTDNYGRIVFEQPFANQQAGLGWAQANQQARVSQRRPARYFTDAYGRTFFDEGFGWVECGGGGLGACPPSCGGQQPIPAGIAVGNIYKYYCCPSGVVAGNITSEKDASDASCIFKCQTTTAPTSDTSTELAWLAFSGGILVATGIVVAGSILLPVAAGVLLATGEVTVTYLVPVAGAAKFIDVIIRGGK